MTLGMCLNRHVQQFLQLTPEQRTQWQNLLAQKLQPVHDMPHDTLDERISRAAAGLKVWNEMEQWTKDHLAANEQEKHA
jgi:hypothetical protein